MKKTLPENEERLRELAKAIHDKVFRWFFEFKTGVFLCGAGKNYGKGDAGKKLSCQKSGRFCLWTIKELACAQRTRRTSGAKPLSRGYSVERGVVDRAVIYYFTSVPITIAFSGKSIEKVPL
jgi:hypothetical protein